MNNYTECIADTCDNLTINKGLCHFHKSITSHKRCANIYIKYQVEWCNVKDDRVDNLDCERCEDRLDPIEHIKLCEKMWKKGLNNEN
jgi:hypothetical protein